MRTRTALVAVATLLVSLVASASAHAAIPNGYQVQRVENPTPAVNERFGDGLVNGGDYNGDGKDDILVGIDEHGTISGELHLISGANGSVIRSIPAPDPDAGGTGDNPDAFGTYVGKIADIGKCTDATPPAPGADCAAGSTTGDGVPEILASAVGVDVDAAGDDMGTDYVIDGATGSVLKRIRMPAADRTAHAANQANASQGGAFGRTILAPAGLAPCAGNAGIGPCPGVGAPSGADPYAQPTAVRVGDLDGRGTPDIVIGSSDFTEVFGTNPNCTTPVCFQTGRFYVYFGEDLDIGPGKATPANAEETPAYTLKNPSVQPDDNTQNSRFHREAMGYSVAPVGDLGKCNNTTPIAPGDDPDTYYCLNAANNTTTPDGKPDFIASSHRTDASGLGDVGMAFAIDGPTGRIIDVYNHPQPQQSAVFAFSNYNQPAMGDLGSSTAPDVYQGAMVQDVQHHAQGRGWVLSGDLRFGGANHYEIAMLDDPTPNHIGNFSTSSAGIGDVEGDARRELAIGAYGPHAPQVIDNVLSDVHIFSALGERVLQTIPDPDQQPGSGFGRALAPLGDLNGDGFLDFVVGAGGFDPGNPVNCSPCNPGTSSPAQGRIYILRSDNSLPPATAPGGNPTAGLSGNVTGSLLPGTTGLPRVIPGVNAPKRSTDLSGVSARGRKGDSNATINAAGAVNPAGGSVVQTASVRKAQSLTFPLRLCSGKVRVTVKRGRRTLARRNASLRSANCRWSKRVRFPLRKLPRRLRPKGRRVALRVHTRYLGNQYLRADSGKPKRVVIR